MLAGGAGVAPTPFHTRTYCGAHRIVLLSEGAAPGGTLKVSRCCSSVSSTVPRSLPSLEISSGMVGKSGAVHGWFGVVASPRQGIHCAEAGAVPSSANASPTSTAEEPRSRWASASLMMGRSFPQAEG